MLSTATPGITRTFTAFIAEGEIGELAIVRVSQPDIQLQVPLRGHGPEEPAFHDCGMHYVDVARWYAQSEYTNVARPGHSYVGLQRSPREY